MSGAATARPSRSILLLFFLSGTAGLIYQVVWTRMLSLVFGATVLAVSTVLTVFMAGLAGGSFFFGRRADRRGANLLSLYGRLEIGIGVYCLLSPFLVGLIKKVYVAASPSFEGDFMGFSLFRFGLSVLVLALPTFLMGGTLPILAKYVVRRFEGLGEGVGTLYAINTAGAVLGSFATGYLLIATIGVHATIWLAVAINVGVGLTALVLGRRPGSAASGVAEVGEASDAREASEPGEAAPAPPAPPAASPLTRYGALIVLFVSGGASLIYEIAWSRLLSQVLGSSVYAVSAMLTTFLAGIALGSFLVTRRADRSRNPFALLALLEIGIGICALLATPLLDRLPLVSLKISVSLGTAFAATSVVHFLFAAIVMLVPTLLMGATFPVAARIFARDLDRVGSAVGVVYSWNTVGAILGAFLGGFVVLPALGMRGTILLAAALNVGVGSLYLLLSPRTRAPVRFGVPLVGLGATVLISFLTAQWDRYLLNFGAFDSPGFYQEMIDTKGLNEVLYSYDMRYYEEGLNSNVAVSQEGENLFLQINGRVEASTQSDMQNQLMAAHIPLMLHPRPRTAALVGLGSGITLGSMLLHPLRDVDCIEISPEVVEAASYFTEYHYNALADPRVVIIQDDARNVLLATERKYDVLISEPSKPWITGVSNLFTREYYRECLARLSEGGIMCQWCHYYSMSPEDFKTILRTFSAAFPYAQLWNVGRDVFLLGSRSPIPIDVDLVSKKFEDPQVAFDLARIGVRNTFELAQLFMMGDRELREYVGPGPTNTDDHPIIEFSAPKNLSVYKQEEIYFDMLLFRPRFISYPLLRQVVELRNGMGYDFPLAGVRYLTEETRLTPRVAGIVRTTRPELDPSTNSPVVAYRREAFFDCEDGGVVAIATITRDEFESGALDSALVRVPGAKSRWGDSTVLDHPARWVIVSGSEPDDLMIALSWQCAPNRAQYLVTRRFRGAQNTERILDEVLTSSKCLHRRDEPS